MADAGRCRAILSSVALLLLAVLAGAQQTSSEIQSAVIGKWKIVDVICPTCATHARDEVGSIIQLSDSSITNAYGGDCTDSPGYTLLRKTEARKLLAGKGKRWPQKLRRALQGQKFVIYGYITCNRANHMRVIFSANGPAYYFWEGDTVFVLERTTP